MTIFPVIASTLSEKELGDFIKKRYELTDDYNCKLYRTGVNHTYFISKNETKLVLRVYCYQWRTKLEIEQELELLNLLKENSFSVSIPILDKKENFIQEINGIPEAGASIYIFLGIQTQRFDWSNILITENYLKMYVERIKNWIEYSERNNNTKN